MKTFVRLASGLLSVCFCFALTKSPLAVNMSSDDYRIQWGNINIGGGKPDSDNYQLGITVGQIAPGLYSKNGYKVRAGFQYIHSIVPFSFSISDLTIDFGTLTSQNPVTATNTLTVSTGNAGGYQVLANETHPLENQFASQIPDTTCDNGNCTESSAEIWTENDTYGFGFNVNGDDTPADFVNTNYFRQFANQENNEAQQAVMINSRVSHQSQATVSYKVNISATQAAGDYETSIVYTAVPGY